MDTLLQKRRIMMEHSEWKGDFIGEDTPGINISETYLKESGGSWRVYNDASTSVRIPITPGATYRLHLDENFSSGIYMAALVDTDTMPSSNTTVNTYYQLGQRGYLISGRTEWNGHANQLDVCNDVVFKIEKSDDPNVKNLKYLVIQVSGINWSTSTESQRYALFNHIYLQKK